MTTTVTFLGEPVPKARARTANGHAYTPERTVTAEALIRWAWHKDPRRAASWSALTSDDRYEVCITFHRATKRRADIDNLAKTVLDALNGLAWKDDSQIDTLTLIKCPAPKGEARTVLTVELIPREQ